MRLNVTSPCIVAAEMIEASNDVEILTPDHIICTLAKWVHLEIELGCETRKGYVPAISKEEVNAAIEIIPIDALFCHVKQVNYKVENMQVGQVTDYDKLIMSIETNCSIYYS